MKTRLCNPDDLANAIILQAMEDITTSRVKLCQIEAKLQNPSLTYIQQYTYSSQQLYYQTLLEDCLNFFKSEWYHELTSLDGNYLIELSVRQANFQIWQLQKGCKSCRTRTCPYKATTAWQLWEKSHKECPKNK